ncbi:hypothetical protein Kpho02_10600 [Kitasatospora phosalacinea]|uniref:Uncharacterized protein n=1 Tax=Kitasatospora phosalacinea TaxID=2065 RepID=A0A9W6UYK5_9ACTN|nr:hypothetical protein Kpho02_10600 [Kitasatospora phosalacinea]
MLKVRRILVSAVLLGITVFLGVSPASADSYWRTSETAVAPVALMDMDSHW